MPLRHGPVNPNDLGTPSRPLSEVKMKMVFSFRPWCTRKRIRLGLERQEKAAFPRLMMRLFQKWELCEGTLRVAMDTFKVNESL